MSITLKKADDATKVVATMLVAVMDGVNKLLVVKLPKIAALPDTDNFEEGIMPMPTLLLVMTKVFVPKSPMVNLVAAPSSKTSMYGKVLESLTANITPVISSVTVNNSP